MITIKGLSSQCLGVPRQRWLRLLFVWPMLSGGIFAQERGPTEDDEYVRFPATMIEYRKVTFSTGFVEEDLAEKPVRISVDGFAIARHEVTVGEFRSFVEGTGYKTTAEKGELEAAATSIKNGKLKFVPGSWDNVLFDRTDAHPVTCVSFTDAKEYCAWLTGSGPKYTYRLPTGAEWQRACEHNAAGEYDFDLVDAVDHVNVIDESLTRLGPQYPDVTFDDGFPYTAPVNAKKPGGSGLVFMHGNVSELCTPVPEVNADLLERNHLVYGGSWLTPLAAASSVRPMVGTVRNIATTVGFRVVRVKLLNEDTP